MSNNDGCIISRSNEVKALGIPMGAPVFKYRDTFRQKGVTLFSSNYELYADMSSRVEYQPEPQKGLAVTRSFSHKLTEWPDIKEALVHHATRAGEKLRHKELKARHIQVFMHTSRFESKGCYSNAIGITMPRYTSNTPELIHYATHLGHKIYKRGFRFAKCGITFNDIANKQIEQPDLLIDSSGDEKAERLMLALDTINRNMGKHTAYFAASGVRKRWITKRDQLSPSYTTKWSEIALL